MKNPHSLPDVFVLDTETTGLDTENDVVISIAFKKIRNLDGFLSDLQTFYRFYKNSGRRRISYRAMATHHITEEFLESTGVPLELLCTDILCNIPANSIIIGHNVKFDLLMIKNSCRNEDFDKRIESFKILDTHVLALCLKIDQECDSMSVSGLSYFLRPDYASLYAKDSHNALADVNLTIAILQKMITMLGERKTFEDLVSFVNGYRIDKFTFGKHKGKTFDEVAESDPTYFDYIEKNMGTFKDELFISSVKDFLKVKSNCAKPKATFQDIDV